MVVYWGIYPYYTGLLFTPSLNNTLSLLITQVIDMTKSGADRAAKYAAKYDPTVVSARYTATKDAAVVSATTHQTAMGDLALSVRGILNAAGIAPINTVRFIGYANKLYGLSLKFQGVTGRNEAIANTTDWISKITGSAADKLVLAQIWNLFSAEFGTSPSPFPA